ncbi:glycosyltransferase, partial [Acinetobacter baumannii]|uniref:glycosyltransferase n=2 Tax=Bacteria TaxID=2 RepID=UPI002899BFC7
LSPSATESFHLAPVEGMVSGAVPVVWDREGARDVFDDRWIVADAQAAAQRILDAADAEGDWAVLSDLARTEVGRYDERVVADLWRDAVLPPRPPEAPAAL